jgi:hypothetical protein
MTDDDKDDKVSAEFKKGLESLVSEMETKYSDVFGSSGGEVAKQFQARPRKRRKNRVADEAESLGFNLDDFETLSVDETKNIVGKIKSAKKYGGTRLKSLDKYIIKDTFGEPCGIFSSRAGKTHFRKMLDVQENCIKELSKASGILWDVYGYPVGEYSLYGMFEQRKVGEVFCVGIGNALALSSVLCNKLQYNFAYVKINKEYIVRCC